MAALSVQQAGHRPHPHRSGSSAGYYSQAFVIGDFTRQMTGERFRQRDEYLAH